MLFRFVSGNKSLAIKKVALRLPVTHRRKGHCWLYLVMMLVFQHNMLPVFARTDPVQLRVRDAKLPGYHFQAVLVVSEQFF